MERTYGSRATIKRRVDGYVAGKIRAEFAQWDTTQELERVTRENEKLREELATLRQGLSFITNPFNL